MKGVKLNSYLKKNYPSEYYEMTEGLPILKKILFLSNGTLTHFIYKTEENWNDEKLSKMRKDIIRQFHILCLFGAVYLTACILFIWFLNTTSPESINVKWFWE
jgi:hypothetical protein